MVHQGKELATKPHNQSCVPGTQIVKREDHHTSDEYMCAMVCAYVNILLSTQECVHMRAHIHKYKHTNKILTDLQFASK